MSDIIADRWIEKFAWLPVRSTWSSKLIWFKKYHVYEFEYISRLGIAKKHFIYTANEYIITILRDEEKIY